MFSSKEHVQSMQVYNSPRILLNKEKEVVKTLKNKEILVVDDDENDTVNKIWHVLKNVENE